MLPSVAGHQILLDASIIYVIRSIHFNNGVSMWLRRPYRRATLLPSRNFPGGAANLATTALVPSKATISRPAA